MDNLLDLHRQLQALGSGMTVFAGTPAQVIPELASSKPHAVLAGVHSGTVSTALSKPFKGGQIGRPPQQAARDVLQTLNALQPANSGCFVAYDGQPLPW